MQTKTVMVINPTGLHARPATEFVRKATSFACEIRVKNMNTGKEVNAKSIVMLLTLALTKGTPMQISAEGENEETAVKVLADLVEGGFGEV